MMRRIYDIYWQLDGMWSRLLDPGFSEDWSRRVDALSHTFCRLSGCRVDPSVGKTMKQKHIYSTTIHNYKSYTYAHPHTHTHMPSLHTTHYITSYVNGMHGVFCSFIIICCCFLCRNTNQTSSDSKSDYAFNMCCFVRFHCLYIHLVPVVVNRIITQIIILVLENCHRHIVTLCRSHTDTKHTRYTR